MLIGYRGGTLPAAGGGVVPEDTGGRPQKVLISQSKTVAARKSKSSAPAVAHGYGEYLLDVVAEEAIEAEMMERALLFEHSCWRVYCLEPVTLARL